MIDVRQGARMSLALRGTLAPIFADQTVTQAMVTIQNVELVGASGEAVALFSGPFDIDLVALQCQLDDLFNQLSIQAGQFTEMRFQLANAWIQTTDANGDTHVFASSGVDQSQFYQQVGSLQITGLSPDGYVTVALPQSGVLVQGASSYAMHFALNESLSLDNSRAWVLDPRVWLVDQSSFSSMDVQFQASSAIDAETLSSGFQVIQLDANLRPICELPLELISTEACDASFEFVEGFEGPFVVELLPPEGFALTTAVASSVEVAASTSVEASFSVSSVQQVSSSSFAIQTSSSASVVASTSSGITVSQTTDPVGAIADVAPHKGPAEPLRHGERALGRAPVPQLPGVPMAKGAAAPPPAGKGAPPMPPSGKKGAAMGKGAPPSMGKGAPPPATGKGAPSPKGAPAPSGKGAPPSPGGKAVPPTTGKGAPAPTVGKGAPSPKGAPAPATGKGLPGPSGKAAPPTTGKAGGPAPTIGKGAPSPKGAPAPTTGKGLPSPSGKMTPPTTGKAGAPAPAIGKGAPAPNAGKGLPSPSGKAVPTTTGKAGGPAPAVAHKGSSPSAGSKTGKSYPSFGTSGPTKAPHTGKLGKIQ